MSPKKLGALPLAISGRAHPLETRFSATYVIMPFSVILGETTRM